MRHNRQLKAIGLLELMLVLILAALILLIAFSYYRSAATTQSVNNAYTDIATIVGAAQSYWNDHGNDYSGITDIDVLINDGYLTNKFKTNPWGGSTEVKAISRAQLQLDMHNIDIRGCRALMLRLGIPQTQEGAVCGFRVIGTQDADLILCVSGVNRYAACGS